MPRGNAAEQAAAVAATVPVLETTRLRLRAPVMSDLGVWIALLEADDMGFLGGPFTEEEAWESFCVYVAGWMLHGHGLWSVEDARGRLIGFVLLGLEWGDEAPEIGWMLLPEHRGQGLATEAAIAVRDHAIRVLGSGQAVSYVDERNTASNRLAERIGASREGTLDGSIVWRHGAPS